MATTTSATSQADTITEITVHIKKINVTVVSLDSATGKEPLLLILHFICTSFCDRALSPHQMLKKCIQAVEAWPYMY